MTRYMRSGEDLEPHNPIEDSDVPIELTHRLETLTDTERLRAVRENVEKIYRAAKSQPIEDDEKVVSAMSLIWSPQSKEECYHFNIAPIAARIDDIEWNTAFRVDFAETVAVGSNEFLEVASGFSIPDTSRYDLVPEFVAASYRRMNKLAKRNGGYTYIHPYELEATGKTPYISTRACGYATEYISKLPGITPPESTGPAWQIVEESEISDTYEQDSKNENAETTF